MKKLLLLIFIGSLQSVFGQAITSFDEGEDKVVKAIFSKALLEQQARLRNSVFEQGVNPRNAFYVLNPESNLPNTEQKFADMFSK